MHIVQSPGGVARYLSMYLKYSDKNRFEHILICSLDYKMEKMESLVEHIEYLSMGRQISIINDAKGICDGRAYIDNMENQHIRNIYWEDMIQITLLTVAECEPLKDYYFKFKSKYLDSWNEEY